MNASIVSKLLYNDHLADAVAFEIAKDPRVIRRLAEEMGNKLSDYLEDDAATREKLIKGVLTKEDSKKRLIIKIAENLR